MLYLNQILLYLQVFYNFKNINNQMLGTVCDFRLNYGKVLPSTAKVIAINRDKKQLKKVINIFINFYFCFFNNFFFKYNV